jgi:hypothetical protein
MECGRDEKGAQKHPLVGGARDIPDPQKEGVRHRGDLTAPARGVKARKPAGPSRKNLKTLSDHRRRERPWGERNRQIGSAATRRTP